MIAVTGANGHLGKLVIEGLIERVPANQVIAAIRTPERASRFERLGVQVRTADYSRPETLSTSLHGVKRILLISAADVSERSTCTKLSSTQRKKRERNCLCIPVCCELTVRSCSSPANTSKQKITKDVWSPVRVFAKRLVPGESHIRSRKRSRAG